MDEEISLLFKNAEERVSNTKSALEKLGQELGYRILIEKDQNLAGAVVYEEKAEVKQTSVVINHDIYEGLLQVSEALARSYKQVKIDLVDTDRISWAGTAHEIRQILSTLLQELAPDEDIVAQPDYKLEQNAKGPTQKQRAAYILKKRGAGSKVTDVVKKVVQFEDLIAELVRDVYSRASDAAHRSKDKQETQRLLNYFEAFAHDLLDL